MSVTGCYFVPDSWTSILNVRDRTRTVTCTHRIECNDPEDGPYTAELQALHVGPDALPIAYASYAQGNDADDNLKMMVRSVSPPIRVNTGVHYLATSTFETPGNTQEDDVGENPLNRRTRYWLEWSNDMRTVVEDIHGTKILNVCGKPYPEQIELPFVTPIFCARRNIASLGTVLNLATTYTDAVNADTFYGAQPGYAKVESITAGEEEMENNLTFYPTMFRVHVNWVPWKVIKKEEGWEVFSFALDRAVAAVDDDKSPVSEPVLLGADGRRAGFGAEPIYTEWQCNRQISFSGMGI